MRFVALSYTSISSSTSVQHEKPERSSGETRKLTIREKLDRLRNLAGLTCFEGEFIARLRAKSVISKRELSVLDVIWQRHGSKCGGRK